MSAVTPTSNFSQWEYLLFNGAVLLFPLLFSFEKKINFWKKWPFAFTALVFGSAPFLVWDVLVAGRHWTFHEAVILGPRWLGLPFEEWLFFLCVPYANLFVWENVKRLFPSDPSLREPLFLPLILALSMLLASLGVFLLFSRMEYLTISLGILGLVLLFCILAFRSPVLAGKRGMVMGLLFVGLTLLANGYLTGRPVVLYEEAFLTGLRIFRIPVEDFIFGLAHLLAVLGTYEFFLKKKRFDPRSP